MCVPADGNGGGILLVVTVTGRHSWLSGPGAARPGPCTEDCPPGMPAAPTPFPRLPAGWTTCPCFCATTRPYLWPWGEAPSADPVPGLSWLRGSPPSCAPLAAPLGAGGGALAGKPSAGSWGRPACPHCGRQRDTDVHRAPCSTDIRSLGPPGAVIVPPALQTRKRRLVGVSDWPEAAHRARGVGGRQPRRSGSRASPLPVSWPVSPRMCLEPTVPAPWDSDRKGRTARPAWLGG